MNIIKVLVESDRSICYQLPAGKPEQSRPCTIEDVEQGDTRICVAQPSHQLEMACYYYGVKLIRTKIGKNHVPALAENRTVEVKCSQLRKGYSKIAQMFAHNNLQAYMDTAEGRAKLDRITLGVAGAWLQTSPDPIYIVETCAVPRVFLNEFVKQVEYTSCSQFLFFLQSQLLYNVDQTFLIDCGYDIRASFVDWDTFSLDKRQKLTEVMAHRLMAEMYGLQKSEWNPLAAFSSLVQELKAHGPLVVGGFFGPRYYAALPEKMSLSGLELYYWKSGAQRVNRSDAHTIAIVGAIEENGQQLVIFNDPNDGSNPQNPNQQRRYVISMNNLRTHICDLYQIPISVKIEEQRWYALYGRAKILRPN